MSDPSERVRSPRTGRFLKGRSGNPKGRPRKETASPDATPSAFEIVFEKRVTVTQGGVDRELSVEEALQLRTYQDALDGNRAAQREVLKMIAKREKAMVDSGLRIQRKCRRSPARWSQRSQETPMPPCVFSASPPPTQATEYNADALLLEPWAVQAALSRRRGSKALTPQDVSQIERNTRASETLRWPRRTKS